jgi:AraC-like DNA-binding protein
MRERRFIPMKAVHYTERAVGEVRLAHERYTGFFAEAHAHDELQLTLPLAGRMHLQVAGESHLIGPEGGIVLPAAVPHAVSYLDGELDFLNVTAPASWLAEALAAVGGPQVDGARARVVMAPFLWPLGRQLAAEVDAPGEGSEALLAAGLALLALSVARALAEAPGAGSEGTDPRILRAIDRMLRDHAEELTVAGLAKDALMTPRHFERCFKDAVGTTPRRYLIEVRLAAARQLLESGDQPVTEVALDVGFRQASHFIETFRRATGTTPGEYRAARRAAKG